MMEQEGGEENKEGEGGERGSDRMRGEAWICVWNCGEDEHY